MKRSTYTVAIKVEATFDPSNPKEASAAMAFIATLSEGKLLEIPEGVKAEVTTEAPKLRNHKD